MNHFLRAGAAVWACRLGFFTVLYMLDLAALDAFLLAAFFLTVDVTLCARITRAARAAQLLAGWRQAGHEEAAAGDGDPADGG